MPRPNIIEELMRPTLGEELRAMANFLRPNVTIPGVPVARLLDADPAARIADWLEMLADIVEGSA